MPICDILVVFYQLYVAYHAFVDHLLYLSVISCIAQYVAYQHLSAMLSRILFKLKTLFYIGAERLFYKHVVTKLQRLHSVRVMVSVLRGYQHTVFAKRKKVVFIGKTHLVVDFPQLFDLVYLGSVFVTYRDNLHVVAFRQMRTVIFSSAT